MNLMDETDVKIVGKLLLDARLSYRRIADESLLLLYLLELKS
jgi:DNA-binding Lrp family transcriptional regulator